MNTIERLKQSLEELTFRAHGNTAKLIGVGVELGLPLELRQLSILDDTDMGGVNIGVIAGQVQCTRGTALILDDEAGWIFSLLGNAPLPVGDWWPVLAYLRLEVLVGEVSTTYVGLSLRPIFDLSLAIGWSPDVKRVKPKGIVPEGEKDTALPGSVREILPLCARDAQIVSGNVVVIPHPMLDTHYQFADERFMGVVRALIERETSLQLS